jgi:hypothetical protein
MGLTPNLRAAAVDRVAHRGDRDALAGTARPMGGCCGDHHRVWLGSPHVRTTHGDTYTDAGANGPRRVLAHRLELGAWADHTSQRRQVWLPVGLG